MSKKKKQPRPQAFTDGGAPPQTMAVDAQPRAGEARGVLHVGSVGIVVFDAYRARLRGGLR